MRRIYIQIEIADAEAVQAVIDSQAQSDGKQGLFLQDTHAG
ncbi:MAG: hypothetical protein R2764_13460 [Bacteroidales bacterium]